MSEPQSLKNHGRLDPLYHLLLTLTLVSNLVFAGFHLKRHWGDAHIAASWYLVLSLVAVVALFKLRTYPLKVQDRVIRLEERLRLQALAPPAFHPQIYRLTEDQLIALRFAGDDEVVPLAQAALAEKLTRKQIKERIKNWRADNWRV
jgi:hypothetical protein